MGRELDAVGVDAQTPHRNVPDELARDKEMLEPDRARATETPEGHAFTHGRWG